jgi:ankyrin repeat domain-containing protein 50
MALAIRDAGRLKPEIRLAQAISLFEKDLSLDQKTEYNDVKNQSISCAPQPGDVMRFTEEIDRQNKTGRCFGPRMVNVLQSVQQFASLGDIIIGGSQNIIACGVWTIVRTSILVSVSLYGYVFGSFRTFISIILEYSTQK